MSSSDEQIEFARTVEGLFIKGLSGREDQALKQRLQQAGLDLDKPLLPGYPAATLHRWIEVAADHLYPKLTHGDAVRLMGQKSVPALEDSIIGRALASGLKLIGPRRTLERAERVFRNNGNYQRMTVLEISDKAAKLRVEFVFGIPTFYAGVFEQALSIIGAKNVKVDVLPAPPQGAQLDISWD